MVLQPRAAGKFISENAKHVKVCQKGLSILGEKLIQNIDTSPLTKSQFCNVPLHPKPSHVSTVDWIFVVDTLNFCFWSPTFDDAENSSSNGGVEARWRVNGEAGYFGLCAAINRALKENIDILNSKYYAEITVKELAIIFRADDGKTEIPLLQERVNCLHEVGTILLKQFHGTFRECLEQANGSATKLLQLIIDNFPCFRDESQFQQTAVAFYKRAQILVADIWSCYQDFNAEDESEVVKRIAKSAKFHDIEEITMFADYRVPQVLKYFGVLEYSTELLEVLGKEQILQTGSEYESEIRGCSIHAIELLRDWIRDNHGASKDQINAVLLDQYLWELRREMQNEMQDVPFHRVLSIFY